MRNLELVSLVVHLGDVRTSVLHPASTTHRQLNTEELKKIRNFGRYDKGICRYRKYRGYYSGF